jgi:hypothetical protein
LETISGPHTNELDAVFPWLSAMVPNYIDASMLRCPADKSGGKDGSKPNSDEYWATNKNDNGSKYEYTETDDMSGNEREYRNQEVEACSYLYEFNAAECSWWDKMEPNGWYIYGDKNGTMATNVQANIDGNKIVSWAEAKLMQLRLGDTTSLGGEYDPSQFPLVRCFHHYTDKKVYIIKKNVRTPEDRVLNVALDGHVFLSGPPWEYPLAP